MLKLLKHSGTYFYVNVRLRFSGINTQECNCWVVWRPKDFDNKTWVRRCPLSPYKTRKNIRSSLWSLIWVPQATRRVRGYLWKHLERLRWMPWYLPKWVRSKNHSTSRGRGTNVPLTHSELVSFKIHRGSLFPCEWMWKLSIRKVASRRGKRRRETDVIQSVSPGRGYF